MSIELERESYIEHCLLPELSIKTGELPLIMGDRMKMDASGIYVWGEDLITHHVSWDDLTEDCASYYSKGDGSQLGLSIIIENIDRVKKILEEHYKKQYQ